MRWMIQQEFQDRLGEKGVTRRSDAFFVIPRSLCSSMGDWAGESHQARTSGLSLILQSLRDCTANVGKVLTVYLPIGIRCRQLFQDKNGAWIVVRNQRDEGLAVQLKLIAQLIIGTVQLLYNVTGRNGVDMHGILFHGKFLLTVSMRTDCGWLRKLSPYLCYTTEIVCFFPEMYFSDGQINPPTGHTCWGIYFVSLHKRLGSRKALQLAEQAKTHHYDIIRAEAAAEAEIEQYAAQEEYLTAEINCLSQKLEEVLCRDAS